MGLFDFLKPRKNPHEDMKNQPELQKGVLLLQLEYVKKQIANLRAVGREKDVNKAIIPYLDEVWQCYKNDPYNPSHFTFLANAALTLEAPGLVEKYFKAVIEANASTPLIDLTIVYFSWVE